jgi:hypothetical protein
MTFKNTIKQFNLEEVHKAYAQGDYEKFTLLLNSLVTKNMPLKSTCLDRRLIHYWESKKLFNEVIDNGYLSFFDVCWLNVLQELKELGVPPKIMLKVHAFFFLDNSFFETLFLNSVIDEQAFFSKKIEELSKSNELAKMLKKFGWNNFSISILSILLTQENTCLQVSEDGKVNAFKVSHLMNVIELNKLFNRSFISISLDRIIRKVININDFFSLNQGILEVKESSMNIIKKMFNDNNIQKITFRLNDKKKSIIEVPIRLDFLEFYNKIKYLQKKGTLLDLQIKNNDGNIQLFEVTELRSTK